MVDLNLDLSYVKFMKFFVFHAACNERKTLVINILNV